MKITIRRILCLSLILVVLGGCSIGGGSHPRIIEPTLGQELLDLQKALDDGAITTDEYHHLKRRLKQKNH